MFSTKEKQNQQEMNSPYKQVQLNFAKKNSKSEKERKISNLRQVCSSQAINWHQPIQSFQYTLQQNNNQYSLLLTLFQIVEDPTWRSRIPHLCSLIQILHNQCADKNGYYLSQITNIGDYHSRLCQIFHLNDNLLQEHFKMFIMIYLSYNQKFNILDEGEIALGLYHAGKTRTDNQLPEYLWIISQISVDTRGISKLLKCGIDMLENVSENNSQLVNETLIPIMTSLGGYLCEEKDDFLIHQLLNSNQFQPILSHSLSQDINPDLRTQALLFCSNMLARSQDLASTILNSSQLMPDILNIQCEQQFNFQRLVQMRRRGNN